METICPTDPLDPTQLLLDPLFLPLLTAPKPPPSAPPGSIATLERRSEHVAAAAAQLGPWDARLHFSVNVIGKEGSLFEHKGSADLASLFHPSMLLEASRQFQSTWGAVCRPVVVLMDAIVNDRLARRRKDANEPEEALTTGDPPMLPPSL